MSAGAALFGNNRRVTGEPPPPEDGSWPVDAAIGAAALAARTATDVAGVVSRSAPAKALGGAARWLTRPLARDGQEVRDRIGSTGIPAAQQAVRRVTPGVVQAVDLDGILEALELDELLDRVDVGRLIERVDVAGVVARVDVDALLSSIDIDALLGRVDITALIGRIDLNRLLSVIDLNALLGRIDLNRLLAEVDLDALLSDVDLNVVVARLDVDALVRNTEMGGIIARSTSGVASEALDAVRSQGVGLDNFIARLANRMMRRDAAELPSGPPLLVDHQLALPPAEPGDDDSDRDGAGVRAGSANRS